MAKRKNGLVATEAAAYIAGGGNVLPVWRGGAHEFRAQGDRLREWALKNDCLLQPKSIPKIPDALSSGGAEHKIHFHTSLGRVYKTNNPGSYGSVWTEQGIRKTATQYYYLLRLEWTNELFDSDLRLEGIIDGKELSILISQPWAHPKDIKNPYPTIQEIDEFMTRLEFEPVPCKPYEWFRKSDSFHVCDAKVNNFIKTNEGVVPIDLIVSKMPDFNWK